ncbi:hypothetical protein [Streptomyces solaniscabiei]|uniref:hypothetical protein n=1 Tax=Streptomyces solaniscabiei TaxID=2683255 RepID=UPI001CE2D8E5|nr:hypothetical protein [Streptomyces solaniscabiei]
MRTSRFAIAATVLAAGLLLTPVGTAAAQPSDIEVTDVTADRPAVVQDVAETLKEIQVGLVNAQDVANENASFDQNSVNVLGDSAQTGGSSLDSVND